jgi:hypothetical protein
MIETNAQYLGCVTSDIHGSHLRRQRFGLGKRIGQVAGAPPPPIFFTPPLFSMVWEEIDCNRLIANGL